PSDRSTVRFPLCVFSPPCPAWLEPLSLHDALPIFGDHDLLAAAGLVHVFHDGAGAHVDAATAGAVGLDDAGAAVDDAGGGEIRAGDELHQLIDREVRVVHQRQAAIDHFAQVVRRNVGGHAHGDTGGAVHQQGGNPGGQDFGNLQGAVVVGHPVHGFLVQVGQQLVGQLGAT